MYILKDDVSELKKPEPLSSIVKRLGNPISTTLLHSPCKVFQIPQIDGAIGYHQVGNCTVAIGDPICLPQDIAELTKAFHLHCQECDLKTVYLLAHHDFAHWAINNDCRTLIQVGSELNIDPTNFRTKKKLRWQIKQSIQQEVEIQEYKTFDPVLEDQMKNTIRTWLNQRRGAQIHLGNIDFFNHDAEKRIFYAHKKGKIIGVLLLRPIDRSQGWVMNFYLALSDAPVGTTEHLICSTINSLANENCHFLCLGAISGSKLGEIIGLSAFSTNLANLIFKEARRFFKLDAKGLYFKKFHPNLRSVFLLCRGKLAINELIALKNVLNVRIW